MTNRKIERNKIFQGFQAAESLVNQVIAGNLSGVIIGSPPGLGKTWLVRQECKKANASWAQVSFTDNTHAAFQAFWDTRNLDVICVDDNENLARTEGVANLAKQAWGGKHEIQYSGVKYRVNEQRRKSKKDKDKAKWDAHIPRPRFVYRARPVWLTNLNYLQEENIPADMRTHFHALRSRVPTILWIDASDTNELFEFTTWRATDGDAFRRANFKKQEAEKVLKWWFDHAQRIKDPSMRTLMEHVTPMLLTPVTQQARKHTLDQFLLKPRESNGVTVNLESFKTIQVKKLKNNQHEVSIVPPSKRGK